ncbi:unnamed protein product [Lepeophtheirus salmonis]|uniref:(salmon louse) hypothetical protein n=1 Tax=Lepeophtheirus salmonis TaxID=72036 RepID=A0A817FDQ0_LEPSM|nr:unnamed protein product [Lepeophtheirus salmonis]CAG9477938.1 unnamed protein product [Lepeophtheirus salmonis]
MNHKPLVYIFNPGNELPGVVSTSLSQYVMLLSMFDYSTEHIKGTHNLTTDALSKLPVDDVMPEEDNTDMFMDRKLFKAIEAARTGNQKDVTEKGFTHKKNDFSLRNGLLFLGTQAQKTFFGKLQLNHRAIVKMGQN